MTGSLMTRSQMIGSLIVGSLMTRSQMIGSLMTGSRMEGDVR